MSSSSWGKTLYSCGKSLGFETYWMQCAFYTPLTRNQALENVMPPLAHPSSSLLSSIRMNILCQISASTSEVESFILSSYVDARCVKRP